MPDEPREEFRLCKRPHMELFLAILVSTGAICPECGHGTRVTSKRWARCKKCDKRVERRPVPSPLSLSQEQARG